jgi:Tfp pilus assembly protein FimT
MEVLVVLSVLVAISTIAIGVIPSSGVDAVQSRAGGESLSQLMQVARLTAISRNATVDVVRQTSRTFAMIGPDARGLPTVLQSLELPDVQAVSGGAARVTFLPTGDAQSAIAWNVGIGARPWVLQVIPAGGRTTLTRP